MVAIQVTGTFVSRKSVIHSAAVFVRNIALSSAINAAAFAILFAGKYPANWHGFNVGTYRWSTRIGLYLGYFTDEYPKFSGKE